MTYSCIILELHELDVFSQRPETEKLLFLNLQYSIPPGHFEITET